MRPGRKSSRVGEIQILRDQDATLPLCSPPKIRIIAANEILLVHRMNVVSQIAQTRGKLQGQVFVELCFHRTSGAA